MTVSRSQPSIVTGIRDHAEGDHARGCMGRQYSCECGYDHATDQILKIAADRIMELEAECNRWAEASIAEDDRKARWRKALEEIVSMSKDGAFAQIALAALQPKAGS